MAEPDRAGLLVTSGSQGEVVDAVADFYVSRGAKLEAQVYEALRAAPDELHRWEGRLALAILPPAGRWVAVVDSTAGHVDRYLAPELARRLRRPVRAAMAWPGRERWEEDYGSRARFPRAPPPALPAWEEQPSPGAQFLVFSGVRSYSLGSYGDGEPPGLRGALERRDLDRVLEEVDRLRGRALNAAVQLIFAVDRLDLTSEADAKLLLEVHRAHGATVELSSFQTLRLVQAAARALEPLVLREAVARLGAERDRYVPMLRQLARTWKTQGLEEQAVLLEEAAMELPRG